MNQNAEVTVKSDEDGGCTWGLCPTPRGSRLSCMLSDSVP